MYDIIRGITEKKTKLAAGVMSGTSLDGVDVAFCEIEGSGEATRVRLVYFETVPFTDGEKSDIMRLCSPETGNVAEVCRMNKYLGRRFGQAVVSAAENGGIDMKAVDFVSSHGQTIYHLPTEGATLQIGELAEICAVTGKPCAGDFRPSDMAYGGQGAPLVPFADFVLYRSDALNRVLFNIGGIGNITVLPAGCRADQVAAFDTGPGNVIIDNLMRIHTNNAQTYDKNGEIASKGTVVPGIKEFMIELDDYVKAAPPKSTGREHYTYAFAESVYAKGLELGAAFADVMAAATDYTAYALWYALEHICRIRVDELWVSGGGAFNKYLMSRIESRYPGKVRIFDDGTVTPDSKEAVAFAVLGNEFLHGGINNIISATGAASGACMGKLSIPLY